MTTNKWHPYKFSWGLPKTHIFHVCLVWPQVRQLLLLSTNQNIGRLTNFVFCQQPLRKIAKCARWFATPLRCLKVAFLTNLQKPVLSDCCRKHCFGYMSACSVLFIRWWLRDSKQSFEWIRTWNRMWCYLYSSCFAVIYTEKCCKQRKLTIIMQSATSAKNRTRIRTVAAGCRRW